MLVMVTIDGDGDGNSDGDVETNCWWDQMAEGQVNGLGGTDTSVFPDQADSPSLSGDAL